jgi:catechol 2,3-dioxygenase-like lactoylglutathione lyase family enzyme
MLELLGLRTVIYPAPDLRAATNWFTGLLGQEPYFEELYYVGYNVAGYELALDPNADPADGPRTYWGVSDADVGLAALLAAGAEPLTEVTDVGDGIRVATVREPSGSTLGIIENSHFAPSSPTRSHGPGR